MVYYITPHSIYIMHLFVSCTEKGNVKLNQHEIIGSGYQIYFGTHHHSFALHMDYLPACNQGLLNCDISAAFRQPAVHKRRPKRFSDST